MATADLHLRAAVNDVTAATPALDAQLAVVPSIALNKFANALLWRLFDAEKDRVLYTINLLLFKKTFTVADLAPLLTRWVGPHP